MTNSRRLLAKLAPYLASRIGRRHLFVGTVIGLLLLLSSISLLRLSPYQPHDTQLQYFRATVLNTTPEQTPSGAALAARVRLRDGPDAGNQVTVSWPQNFGDAAYKRLSVGSQLLVTKAAGDTAYTTYSRWYMPGLATILTALVVLVVIVGAWRGLTSLLGLAITVCILSAYVVPQIVAGGNAFVICIEAAIAITVLSIYVAHGVSRRTTVALIGSLLSLGVVIGLTALASYLSGTSEQIGEETAALINTARPVDLSGLLTGGVVIASLGALFDITTGQAATVDEIHRADRRQNARRLFIGGMSVGREHIAALINTLALVYVGVALPTIVLNQVLYNQPNTYGHVPLLVQLNTESIAEEVMRTSVTSAGMLLALPITTWLAAVILPRWSPLASERLKRWLRQL